MDENAAPMTLRILTPAGPAGEAGCDSAVLTLAEGTEGGGGLVGILRDHAPAVMALGEGPIRASLNGALVLETSIRGGFAAVNENVITIVTDSA